MEPSQPSPTTTQAEEGNKIMILVCSPSSVLPSLYTPFPTPPNFSPSSRSVAGWLRRHWWRSSWKSSSSAFLLATPRASFALLLSASDGAASLPAPASTAGSGSYTGRPRRSACSAIPQQASSASSPPLPARLSPTTMTISRSMLAMVASSLSILPY